MSVEFIRMTALVYWVTAELRQRRWAALGLAALVAVAAVVPITAAAAARRTDSVLDRMRSELRPAHGDVQFESDAPPARAMERIAALPGVEHVGEGVVMLARPVDSDLDFFESFGQGARGDSLFREFDRLRIGSGRMPAGADEVLVSTSVAEVLDLRVGARMQIETFSPDGLWAALDGVSFEYDGPVVDMRVVGVGQSPEELTGGGEDAVAPTFVVSDAFLREREGKIGWFDGVFVVRHASGVEGMAGLEKALRAEFPDRDDVGVNTSEEQARIEQAVDVQTVGLVLLALVSAAAATVAIGQGVVRFARGSGAASPILGSLGLGRRALAAGRIGAVLPPVSLGLLAACLLAFMASGAFPTGAGARIEPDPGMRFDPAALGVGLLLGVVIAVVAAGPAVAGSRTRASKVSAIERRLTSASLPVPVAAGLRAAFGRPSSGPVPSRSAMVATSAGVAGILGALLFGASLAALVDTPARYGWNWDFDVALGDNLTDDEAADSARRIEDHPEVQGAMVARIDNVVIEGKEEFVYARQPLVGDLNFSVVAGRPAERSGEVVLGGTTMDRLDVAIGDTVLAEGTESSTVSLRVVGQALFPIVENEDPARGVAMSLDTYHRLHSSGVGFPELYVRAVPDADRRALAADLETLGFVTTDVPPPAILNLRGVDGIPLALAAFLTGLAVIAAVHALLTALRARRRELALLKTLGFVRRQLATTVVVHGLVFAVVGLVVGCPLGFVIGGRSWRGVAAGLGFATDLSIPSWTSLLVPGVLGTFVLVTLLPARAAARTPVADLLRSE